jgi:hypothetical protein
MKRKNSLLYFLISILSFSATASHGSSSYGSIEGLVSMIGLESGNLMHNLSIAATFGLLWLSVYIILKKLVVRFELQELFNLESPGHQDESSKNILAVLALLIIISMMGAGHWIEPLGLIWDIQQLFLTALFFGVLALLISVLGGGAAGVAWTAGQTGHALNEGMQEIQEARQELNNIGNNNGGGGNGNGNNSNGGAADLEDAVDDIESAYSHVEPAIHQAEQDINSDIQEIINAVNNPGRGSSANYRQVGAKIENLRNALELMYEKADTNSGYSKSDVVNGQGLFANSSSELDSRNIPDKYQNFGLKDAINIMQEIRSSADRIQAKDEHDVNVLDDELNSLISDTKDMVKSVKALKKILMEVQDAEDKEDLIEEAAREVDDRKLFDHHRTMDKHEEYLENHLKKDKQELRDLRDNLQEAKRVIKHELEIESPGDVQSMISKLQNDSDSLENILNNLGTELSREFGSLGNISNLLNSIDNLKDDSVAILDGMVRTEKHKIEDDEQILEQIQQAIDAIDEVINT